MLYHYVRLVTSLACCSCSVVWQVSTARLWRTHSEQTLHDLGLLQALLLSHPRKMTRDTATYPPLMMSIGKGQKPRPRSLRHLAETELGLSIQAGEHSPVDDARSTLYLYHKHRKVRWKPPFVAVLFSSSMTCAALQ